MEKERSVSRRLEREETRGICKISCKARDDFKEAYEIDLAGFFGLKTGEAVRPRIRGRRDPGGLAW